MKILRWLCHVPAFALLTLFLTTQLAHAQATRTWVSGVGDDANPCSRTAPCKTFAGAISKTATNGEIDCLDPGGFGAVTITKGITIDCGDGDGGLAGSVLVTGTPGIVVSAPVGSNVTLRNIGIQGVGGGGTSGIRFLSGDYLHVQSVQIIGFSQNGIDVSNSNFALVTVRNSVISDIGQAGINAVYPGFGTVNLDSVQISNAATGVHASTNAIVTMVRTSILGSVAGTSTGVLADASNATVNVDNSLIAFCQTGISATLGGTAHVSNSNINNNVTGVSGNVGSYTPGTNRFSGNTSDGVFGAAATPLK
jgi:hypothetical protein